MAKLFKMLLLSHLTPHIQPRAEQSGFRAKHSTTLQVTKIVNEMAMSHNKKEYVTVILLDMEKAFDKVGMARGAAIKVVSAKENH